MDILMVAAECAPFAQTGGLGEVIGSLPQKIAAEGHDVRVILPKYGCIKEEFVKQMKFKFFIYVSMNWRKKYCGVFELERNGITYYFLDNEFYFGGESLYSWNDFEKFAFFDSAILEVLPLLGFKPDIIHCHDWQSGMVPVVLKAQYLDTGLYKNTKTVFTIHNLRYQGVFSCDLMADYFELDWDYFTPDKLEFYGGASFMKGGIVYSDIITTVSPTYSKEIQKPEFGERLDGLLRSRAESLYGIVNGIDVDVYNPKTDALIFENYGAENFEKGKTANKLALQKKCGLAENADIPMIGIVSRLADQKGFDLVNAVIEKLIEKDAQIVVLGTGDGRYENMFRHYAWKNGDKIFANIVFNAEFSHKIYAASDMFLMPSMFEPCGLGQLIALNYGSVPIVRETGGLKDTVTNFDPTTKGGNGFSFANYDSSDMLSAIERALSLYKTDKAAWGEIVRRGMNEDFGWGASAKRYVDMYKKLI
jgi:starch synthase